ncbi:winged helix-turn-helix domain-containing protein [Streptomyces beijiangensis]|uniref:Helix-turn-helix transcriptional regulator n=1 Tax=Streptomyces beijiangensis TaxID=163361 RepID=A0A939JKL8_9ACTN|nr:helix-turn-helix domain-containing protein [Streptomyces beijiangensis]MBO0517758.1 helix-turn-helix transcriptional regulator [Streptomyces beijiangensis]
MTDATDPTDSTDPLSPDPGLDISLDAAALRVLAHPMRLTLLGRLRQYGPSTARQLARLYDLDSGAASYHLRRLAAGGLIEEDVERGNRRDRWWRAVHRQSFHDPAADAPSDEADSRAYTHAVVLAYGDRLRRVASTVPLLSDAWHAAAIFADYTVELTPGELNLMKAEIVGVVSKYRTRTERSQGSDRVSVQLQAFPLVEE